MARGEEKRIEVGAEDRKQGFAGSVSHTDNPQTSGN